MYIVRFCRADGRPDEEYFYNSLPDANRHFSLFHEDDSGLYCTIDLVVCNKTGERIIHRLTF